MTDRQDRGPLCVDVGTAHLKKASAVVGVTPQEAEIDSSTLGLHVFPSRPDSTSQPGNHSGRPATRNGVGNERFGILYTGAFYGERGEQS